MRSAVIMGVSEYNDEAIGNLPNAMADSSRLRELLQAERVGAFDRVSLVVNPEYREGVEAFNQLFGGKEADDLLLLYIISQMQRDSQGRLHFLFSDSALSSPDSTAMSADWLRRQIARCRSSRIVILIDGSCPGGVPELVAAAEDIRSGSRYASSMPYFPPFGRALIAYEHSAIAVGSGGRLAVAGHSFTSAVCGGLLSGEADLDGDGDITVHDLYGYLKDELLLQFPSKIPLLQTNGTHSGALVVARNSALAPAVPVIAPLSLEVRRLLRSSMAADRIKAVELLGALKQVGTNEQRRAAMLALHDLAGDDSRRVQDAARRIIAPWGDLGCDDMLVERERRDVPSVVPAMNMYIINNSEVRMSQEGWNWAGGDLAGGDLNKQIAGGDITGAAAGRHNAASGISGGSEGDALANLKESLSALTEEVSAAGMAVNDKINALTALQWFQENVESAEEPAEVGEQVGKLRALGGWVWNKFTSILRDLPSAGLAAWLYDLAQHVLH
jgi:hypothetical protein